ncbi:hypothetical protein B0T24DRAFT_670835 [Lasiosphaeria ovina]|uniref:AAA+ ATPase domain-containing protein n=1 Tax=Lasiosphaeria ovina TaxID=92902 RepID=A0AAE0JU39_9PEZI|nr:hypothetical protein B0T24DRAFT_670835 [Lasiosphaeria ovina]
MSDEHNRSLQWVPVNVAEHEQWDSESHSASPETGEGPDDDRSPGTISPRDPTEQDLLEYDDLREQQVLKQIGIQQQQQPAPRMLDRQDQLGLLQQHQQLRFHQQQLQQQRVVQHLHTRGAVQPLPQNLHMQGQAGAQHQQQLNQVTGIAELQRQQLQRQQGLGSAAEDNWGYLRHMTISRDQTEASSFEKERLGALLPSHPTNQPAVAGAPVGGAYALQDYQMQLMLLEQQNKKRLMMARREHEASVVMGSFDNPNPAVVARPANNGSTSAPGVPATAAPAAEEFVSEESDLQAQVQAQAPKYLIDRVAQLEEEVRNLRQSAMRSVTWQILYKIEGDEATYLAEPSWSSTARKEPCFKGNSPLADELGYLRQRPDVAFVVYRHFTPAHQQKDIKKALDDGATLPDPVPARETIALLSDEMVAAFNAFTTVQPSFLLDFPMWNSRVPIEYPYLFWYRHRPTANFGALQEPNRTQMQLLTGWIDQNYGWVHSEVDRQLSNGRISSSAMPYFVRPGEVLLERSSKGIQGWIADSWTMKASTKTDVRPSPSASEPAKITETWTVRAWSYKYDGAFFREYSTLDIKLEYEDGQPDIDMATLQVVPLRFAAEDFHARLERRGVMWWACRHTKLVSYDTDGTGNNLSGQGERYMIDFDTYKKLHADTIKYKTMFMNQANRREMAPEVMRCNEPPPVPELLIFPSTLVAYNLREKKWQDLRVDRIQDVAWNKEAFEHLVVDQETKDLIHALVTSKLQTEQSTDLIKGKGNGLIILLHGGPGTGKTFTAESVAEIAEKPLFRVTCGDVGVKPEDVEKYLESVLHLGKIWGCVVLLDEADVFLEQRTLNDLERNALVSVFLRVLEYYEGILILTSNRVGTFDEAFKSRIQLSLHYDTLNKLQRGQIWKNFLGRLKALEREETADGKRKAEPKGQALTGAGKRKFAGQDDDDDDGRPAAIDFDEIECYLPELAEEEMNGRQIRNAITTGRQLAKFKKVKMSYTHLKHVIKVSSRFDKYLNTM